MKKIFSIIATSTVLLLTSCSKEKSIDSSDPDAPGSGGGGGGNTATGQLVKTVIQLGPTDSTVNYFSYDGQSRFSRQWLGGTQNVMNDNGETRVVRNSAGNIQFIILKETPGSTTDSSVYTVYYNSGAGRYSSKVLKEQLNGVMYKDSVVYSYNASGQIIEELYWVSVDNSPYEEWSKTLFTYTNGNLTEYRGFFMDYNTNAYVQLSHIAIEYDAKQSPLVLGAEGIVLEQLNFVSPNNVTKATVTDLEEPSNNEVVTYAYVYNDKNKPATANITFQSLGLPIPITFYYN